MKIAFHILTFIVCGVAAYYSLSHKEMFESQQETRLETIKTNVRVTASAEVTEKDEAEHREMLAEANRERATASASLESVQADGRQLTSQLNQVESTIQGQQSEISRLNETIADATNKFAEFGQGLTPANVGEFLTARERERDELSGEVAQLEEETSEAEANLASKRADAERVAQRFASRNAQLSLNATEAVISAVNNDWGFVLIGAGSNSGFSPQATMVVQRDGRVIGKVRPSSVEPTQTIAEIDYSSLGVGVRLQPGDRVMLAKSPTN